MPRRIQPIKRIPREALERASEKASEAMAEFIRDPEFFPADMRRNNRLLAAAVDPSVDYPPEDADREKYLPKILRQAEGIIGWCEYGMRVSSHQPKDFLASSYRKAILHSQTKPDAYLAMKGYEVFMEELGLDPEAIRRRRVSAHSEHR